MKSVDIVVPIYYNNVNEIEQSVHEQIKFYEKNIKDYEWTIIIGLNGPNKNNVLDKVKGISETNPKVKYDYTSECGRGASLNRIFLSSKADYVCYMDVDLATRLDALLLMLEEFDKFDVDVVAGSKYLKTSKYQRIPLRLFLSKIYNLFFTRVILNARFTDAQCGFKGIRKKVVKEVIPLIKDRGWFWDTEMLYIVQKKKLNYREIPVYWTEKGNSGVKIFKTVKDFLIKTIELKYRNL